MKQSKNISYDRKLPKMAASTSKSSEGCMAYANHDYWQTNSLKNVWTNTATNKANQYPVFGNTTQGQYNSHWSWTTLGWSTLARNTPSISKHARGTLQTHLRLDRNTIHRDHIGLGLQKTTSAFVNAKLHEESLETSPTHCRQNTHFIRAYQFNMAPRSNTQHRNQLFLC